MRRTKQHLLKLVISLVVVGVIVTLITMGSSETGPQLVPLEVQINRKLRQDVPIFSLRSRSSPEEAINIEGQFGSLAKMVAEISDRLSHLEDKFENSERKSFLSGPIINPYNVSSVNIPLFNCLKKGINILLMIPSHAIHFLRRQDMRSGPVGTYAANSSNSVKLLFFIGMPEQGRYNKKHQLQIKTEAETYDDIVQENYEDVYSNNKFKTISMLRWVNKFCANAKYVIMADSEITFDIPTLESVLDSFSETETNFILGKKRVRETSESKIQKNKRIKKGETITYATKTLQGYPLSTAKLFYEAALRVEADRLESLFIDDALAAEVHVPTLTDPDFDFQPT